MALTIEALIIKLRRKIKDTGPLDATPTEGAFSDDELEDILNDVLDQLSGYEDLDEDAWYTWTTVPARRSQVLILMAAIECCWVLATDSARWFSLSVDIISLSRGEVFQHYMDLIDKMKEDLSELLFLLGLQDAEFIVGDLRRVSRLTERLVPLYDAREYDDSATPIRRY